MGIALRPHAALSCATIMLCDLRPLAARALTSHPGFAFTGGSLLASTRRARLMRSTTLFKNETIIYILSLYDRNAYRKAKKKKRHTLKTRVVVDKKRRQIICTAFSNGKRHDFRLFKESKTHIHRAISVLTDSGYQGCKRCISRHTCPKKRAKSILLQKKINRTIENSLAIAF